jgi:adenosylcobinamide-GDP ribazoletransferase
MKTSLRDALQYPVIALEFLTILRIIRPRIYENSLFAGSVSCYPIIGLGIGALLWVAANLLEQIVQPEINSAILLIFLTLLSGGLHLDGLADTADGLASQGTKADKLGIMSIGNTGPAGAVALVLTLLLQWVVLSEILVLSDQLSRSALIITPMLARWSVIPMIGLFPPARLSGLGNSIQQSLITIPMATGTITAIIASVFLLGALGILLIFVTGITSITIAWLASKQLEGTTGDILGAGIELSQTTILLIFLILSEINLLSL